MMIRRIELRPGAYHDSVALMRVSRDVADLPGVEAALVAMATELNLAILADLGFDLAETVGATADDLLIAITAVDEAAVATAWDAVAAALAPPPAQPAGAFAPPDPRTVEAAAVRAGANLAVISVPGPHAFVEAMAALHAGLNVMVFSDNVPTDQEVVLKAFAAETGLLVMGPDCGTAIIGGVGLGFANVVQPGPVSITGASGTGIQQLCCLLDDAGVGVRHALGTGSRDLSTEVGASSTIRSLAALDEDPATEVIIVVSKPPAPSVAERVRRKAATCATPTVFAFVGEASATLESATAAALRALDRAPRSPAAWSAAPPAQPRAGALVGLFSGGTLRDEARLIAGDHLGPIADTPSARGHRLVDLGDDEFTRGRPHPMIDQRLRMEHLAAAAADPATAAILLDVVLGHGSHPDPAAELAPHIGTATAGGLPVLVSLCGSRGDPQDRGRQVRLLREAGASVWLSNAAAARAAVSAVAS